MILRHSISPPFPQTFFSLVLLLSSAVHVTAQGFDCHVTAGGLTWDLTALSGVQTLRRTRDTPPTSMVDELRFNLCEDLEMLRDVPEGDQASSLLIYGANNVHIHTVLIWDKGMLDEDEHEGWTRPGNIRHTSCAVAL